MRKRLIAGNWKMYKTVAEAVALVNSIKGGVQKFDNTDVVVCPPFTALDAVSKEVSGTKVGLGAQNMYVETEGAFTGEVSPMMLKDIGCRYVIIGHSERRAYFHETDASVNQKLLVAHKFNLIPIVCLGETLKEREEARTEEVIARQFKGAFQQIANKEMSKTIIAYEPVWAIGTGKTATPKQAEEVHRFIRRLLSQSFAKEVSDHVRILYGGSVKPDNIAELIKERNIDGALVGGASLKAEFFIQIVEAADKEKEAEQLDIGH